MTDQTDHPATDSMPPPEEPAFEAELVDSLPPEPPGKASDKAREDVTSITRYDPLQAYLHEIQRYKLLSPPEEHDLAVRYVEGGDTEAAARLVTANLRLVVKIAFEYRKTYRNLMDLIQEGNIGLLQAVRKFDPYREVKLSSYAAWWIRAYILRFILNNWRMVKLGTTQAQRKLFFNLNKEKARLAAMGFEPTPEMMAERLNVTVDEVVEMDHRLHGSDVSLDAPIGDGEGKSVTRLDLLPDTGKLPESELSLDQFQHELKDKLQKFGEPLTGKERFIFENRLLTDQPLTLQQIGEHFKVSRERIRQIEKRLLETLRSFLMEEMGEHFDVR